MNEALNQFQAALRLQPGYANAELAVGKALLSLDRDAEAKRHLENALRLNPGLQEARQYLDELNQAPSPTLPGARR